ncbi:MAG: hypothetical protein KBA44_11270, partial [Methanoculleus sp.]|nr:hypothetical protein [Methanoculleus sp.]
MKPAGQRGEHWKSDPVNLPGKGYHGETNVESLKKIVTGNKRKQTGTLEPKWYGTRLYRFFGRYNE